MSLSLILTIIIVLIVIAVLFKILKSVIKTGIVLIALFLIVTLVFGGLVLIDANNFRKSLFEEKSTYVLVDGDEVLTSTDTSWDNFSDYENSDVQSLDDINKENQTFIVEQKALQGEIEIDNQTTTWDDLLTQIKNTTDVDLKNKLFLTGFANAAKNEGPLFLFNKMKDKTITVVRENTFVKFIKLVPSKILSSISTQKVEE